MEKPKLVYSASAHPPAGEPVCPDEIVAAIRAYIEQLTRNEQRILLHDANPESDLYDEDDFQIVWKMRRELLSLLSMWGHPVTIAVSTPLSSGVTIEAAELRYTLARDEHGHTEIVFGFVENEEMP